MNKIYFHSEDRDIPSVIKSNQKEWIQQIVEQEGFQLNGINYIFCSDEYLLKINQEHLEHDFYTDIITFDNSETPKEIEGDIFISVDRVIDNAAQLNIPFEHELWRVLAHGVLHLCGYGDKTDQEIQEMRRKEEEALQRLN